MIAACRWTQSPNRLALLSELGALSQWLCYDKSIVNPVSLFSSRWYPLRTTVRGLEETSRTATQFLGPDCY